MSQQTPLATIQKIVNIQPIEGADKIELAFVKSWQVVVKKGEFNIGDLVIYIEINAQMPEKPEYEFLRPRKFRVRTIKLRGCLSQGLILPITNLDVKWGSNCSPLDIQEGIDITEKMGITKYDPEEQEEKALQIPKPKNKVMKFLMDFRAFRFIYLALNKKEKGSFPSNIISKSDEENLQNCAQLIMNNFDKSFYITEKLEGQSATFYTTYERVWGFKKKIFGVCSRNLRLAKPDNSKYWASARKYDLEKTLKSYPNIIAVQAEQVGVGIQENIYKLKDVELFVFTVKKDGQRMAWWEMAHFCNRHNLKTVPLINADFIPSQHIYSNDKATIVSWLIDYSNGKSLLYDTLREGIVMRLIENPQISFKVKSPDYLIKHGA